MKKTLFVTALVILASVSLFAGQFGTPIHVKNNTVSRGHITESNEPTALKKIYSNLGPSTHAFDYTDGWLITGSSSPLGESQWIGYSFTPTKKHTATQLRAAMFYYDGLGSGGNDFNFGIWSTTGSVPNAEIQGKDKKNLPTWTGTSSDCCKTQNVTIKATKLKKGTAYWFVMTNAASETNAIGAWDFVYNDADGTQAYDIGGAGWNTEDVEISAFAVYGTS